MKIYKQNKAIGILGGMGPQASARLYELIIKYAKEQGASTNDSYPEIILYSIPVPDFITSDPAQREMKDERFPQDEVRGTFISDNSQKEIAKKMLVDRVRALSVLPISYFCIACNTAHVLLSDLREATKVPFISLVDETINELKTKKVRKVGLLATPSTINSGLYQSLCRNEKIEIIQPMENEIVILGEIIKRVISGESESKDKDYLRRVAKKMINKGTDVILLGCTELPLIFPKKEFKVISTLDVLAKACINKYYGNI